MKRMFGGIAAMVGTGLLAFGAMGVPQPIDMNQESARFALMVIGGALLLMYSMSTFRSATRRDRAGA
ncbi:MAG TPA: hypothetical protein VKE69_12800 [Planctomycetota bacterium]|nr:hypothetical protein [Planctomycetota bacterium]